MGKKDNEEGMKGATGILALKINKLFLKIKKLITSKDDVETKTVAILSANLLTKKKDGKDKATDKTYWNKKAAQGRAIEKGMQLAKSATIGAAGLSESFKNSMMKTVSPVVSAAGKAIMSAVHTGHLHELASEARNAISSVKNALKKITTPGEHTKSETVAKHQHKEVSVHLGIAAGQVQAIKSAGRQK